MSLRQSIVAASAAALFAFSGLASADTVFVGGHDPSRMFRNVDTVNRAPYALTGSTTSNAVRVTEIRVGSRIIATVPNINK